MGPPSVKCRAVRQLQLGPPRSSVPLLRLPGLDLELGRLPGNAVHLADVGGKLVALAADAVEVVGSDLRPALFDERLVVLPIAFDAVPLHGVLQKKNRYVTAVPVPSLVGC